MQYNTGPGPGTGPAASLGPWPLGSLAQSTHKSVHAQRLLVYAQETLVYTQERSLVLQEAYEKGVRKGA